MVLDILCLLLSICLCLLLSLVGTNGYSLGTFLTQHIGEERSGKVGLVVLLVISKPHTLPLLTADLTSLNSLSVNSWNTQDDTGFVLSGFGLEDVHTLNTSQLFSRSLTLEEINLQLWLFTGHDIVFGGHILTQTLIGFVIALLNGRKELVHVCLVGIDGESLFVLWFEIHSPLAFVILQHKDFVKVNSS